MSNSLGSAWISIHADTSAFTAEMRKAIELALKKNSPLTIRIEADATRAKATLDAFVAAANRKKISIPLDIDTRPGAHSLAQLGLDSEQQASRFGDSWGRAAHRVQQDLADVSDVLGAALGGSGAAGGDLAAAVAAATAAASTAAASGLGGAAGGIEEVGAAAEGAAAKVEGLGGSVGKLPGAFGPVGIAALAVAAAIGAVAVAAEGLTAAVAGIGIVGSEGLRSLRLELSNTGLQGEKLESTLAGIQRIAETGLGLQAAGDATTALLRANESSAQALATVSGIEKILFANGETGKVLSKNVTDTTAALVDLSNTAIGANTDVGALVATLGLPVKTNAVLDALAKDLNVTGKNAEDARKKVEKLIAAGKVTGQQIGTAALEAGANLPNTNAIIPPSVVQSALASVQKIKDSLGTIFDNPAAANAVTKFGDQVQNALAKFGPEALSQFQSVLGAVGGSLDSISSVLLTVSQGISNFFTEATTKGNPANDLLVGIKGTVSGVGDALHLAFDLLKPGLAALGPLFRIFGDAVKIIGDVAGAIRKIIEPLTFLTSGAIYAGVKLIADGFDIAASAADKLAGAATFIRDEFIKAIDFVLTQVENLIKALDFHVGPIHIQVPGADAAIAKIESIKAGLNAIPSSVTSVVNIVIATTGGIPSTFKLPDGTTIHDSEASRAAGALTGGFKPAKPKAPPGNPPGPSGPSAADKAAQAAADKAKALADKIKTATDNLKTTLAEFAHDVSGETSKQIRTAVDGITKSFRSLAKLEDLPAGKVSKVVALLQKDSLSLQKLAAERIKVEKAIAAGDAAVSASFAQSQAFTSLSSIADAVAQAADAAKNATKTVADLSRLHILKPGEALIPGLPAVSAAQTSLAAIQSMLDARVAQITKFNLDVKAAEKLGLRADVASDLFKGGPEQDSALAATLAGATPAQIAAINKSAGAARSAAGTLAKAAGDALASEAQSAGQQVVNGLLEGLKDKDGKLKAQLKALGKLISQTVKDELHIKSPSRVFVGIAHRVLDGLHLGLTSTPHLARVSAAASGMAAAAVPRLSPVSMPTLTALANAQARSDLRSAMSPQRPAQAASTGMSAAQHRELVAALQSVAAGKTYNTPVTMHVTAPAHDPHAVAKALAKAVAGIR